MPVRQEQLVVSLVVVVVLAVTQVQEVLVAHPDQITAQMVPVVVAVVGMVTDILQAVALGYTAKALTESGQYSLTSQERPGVLAADQLPVRLLVYMGGLARKMWAIQRPMAPSASSGRAIPANFHQQ